MEFRVYIIYSEKPPPPQQNKNQRTLRRDLVLYSITLLMSFDMIARGSYRKFFGTSLPIF